MSIGITLALVLTPDMAVFEILFKTETDGVWSQNATARAKHEIISSSSVKQV